MKTFAAHFKTEDGVLLSALETTGYVVSNDEVFQVRSLELSAHVAADREPLHLVAKAVVECYKSTNNSNDVGKPANVIPGLFSTATAAFTFMAEKRMRQALECSAKAAKCAGGAA